MVNLRPLGLAQTPSMIATTTHSAPPRHEQLSLQSPELSIDRLRPHRRTQSPRGTGYSHRERGNAFNTAAQIGAAIRPPVAEPSGKIGCGRSKPIHTSATKSGVTPTN